MPVLVKATAVPQSLLDLEACIKESVSAGMAERVSIAFAELHECLDVQPVLGNQYPISHGHDIRQYHDETFVWYDEAGLQGGVTYTLEQAQAAAKKYAATL